MWSNARRDSGAYRWGGWAPAPAGALAACPEDSVRVGTAQARRRQQTMAPDAGRKAAFPRRASVASPIICRSALAIEAHRGVASLANTLGMGCAMRLALRSDGCAQPTTSDR